MNMYNIALLGVFTGLFVCGTLCSEKPRAVGVQLVGVYNMLTPASNYPSKYAATVKLAGEKVSISGSPWRTKPIRLPVDIEVWFQNKNIDQGKAQPYIIRIDEDSGKYGVCSGDKISVKAEVYLKMPGENSRPEAAETTCVSTAKFGLRVGDMVSQFQNVVLFLADQDSQDTSALPFKFGIAGWTATAGMWGNAFVSYSPACSQTGAPRFDFALKDTEYLGKHELRGLFVLQGHPAWGGGLIPRPYHMHIVHIFNNSKNPLLIRRNTPYPLNKYNFEYTVPARTAMPFAYVWLPKVSQSDLNMQSNTAVSLYVLKKAQRNDLPAGFNPLDLGEGTSADLALNASDIDERVNQVLANMSPVATTISGYDKRIAELQRDTKTEVWAAGKYMYKLCAVPAKIDDGKSQQDIVCVRRDSSGEEKEILRIQDKLFQGYRAGADLRLIVNDKEVHAPDDDELIEIKLDKYVDTSVFEGYLGK
jgi:hypothetical protein